MADLLKVQSFITTYIRDERFRDEYARDPDAAAARRGLGPDEVSLVRQIDVKLLDKTAGNFRKERTGKRIAEFQEFVEFLGLYADVEAFFEHYDRSYPDGLLTREVEMKRFLEFGVRYVYGSGLPEFLIDVLRLAYVSNVIAESPRQDKGRGLRAVPEGGIGECFGIFLRRPHRTVEFRYPVLDIVQKRILPRQLSFLPPRPTTLFIQKHYGEPTRARIMPAESAELFEALRQEEMVFEVLYRAPRGERGLWLATIYDLFDQGVIGLERTS